MYLIKFDRKKVVIEKVIEKDKNKNKIEINENINNKETSKEIEENYDLIFPDKYHKEIYKLINTAKTENCS